MSSSRQTSNKQLHLPSKSQLVILHMRPVALASLDYLLVGNIFEEWDLPGKVSPKNHDLFIPRVTWSGLFWSLFNVSSEDQHVRVCV